MSEPANRRVQFPTRDELRPKGRCLGLVGGLGVGATTHYYRNLVKQIEERGRAPDIVIVHAETSRVFTYVQAQDRNGLAAYLTRCIRRMQAAGAEIVAIPAVTPHFCVRELIETSPLPVCNIFEPVGHELEKRSCRRVSVFGTRFVMESALFGFAGNVEIIAATPDEVAYIHETYMELAQQGAATEEQHRNLTAIAHALLDREALDAIVLAGTDLALLFNETNTDFPHIDCAALHISAILNQLWD